MAFLSEMFAKLSNPSAQVFFLVIFDFVLLPLFLNFEQKIGYFGAIINDELRASFIDELSCCMLVSSLQSNMTVNQIVLLTIQVDVFAFLCFMPRIKRVVHSELSSRKQFGVEIFLPFSLLLGIHTHLYNTPMYNAPIYNTPIYNTPYTNIKYISEKSDYQIDSISYFSSNIRQVQIFVPQRLPRTRETVSPFQRTLC